MGKHETGYQRIERDYYPTPPWATEALLAHVDIRGRPIWECACGDGRMAEVLKAAGAQVYSTDIVDRGYAGFDALHDYVRDPYPTSPFEGVITNPPFGPRGKLAELFIEIGLKSMDDGFLALLLPTDFDSAKTRAHLFGACPEFAAKIVLNRRVKWFENPLKPKMSPKENSAWFLWGNIAVRHTHRPPVIAYAPHPTQSLFDAGLQPQRPCRHAA
jgi:hypothetical protein